MTDRAFPDTTSAMIERDRPIPETVLPAHEQVYRTLRARVMHGAIAPGVALTLRGIAGEFGVSMTPAREAVRRLVAEGALKLSSSGRISLGALGREDRGACGAARAPRADSRHGPCRAPISR